MPAVTPVHWSHAPPFPKLHRAERIRTVQVNLGYVCNQTCFHCHVNAGPNRREVMAQETLAEVLDAAERLGARELDLTGGAPELNPAFRWLLEQARQRGLSVIDRCNLTILSEPGQEDLATLLAEHGVRVIASLPCYQPDNVDLQRGDGVFRRSVDGLRRLNELGYAAPDSGRVLDLVYNPLGPDLPPPQEELEQAYREALQREFGIRFNQLLTIANMPINRFAKQLRREGRLHRYMEQLRAAHNDANLEGVMCRHLISVDWQGHVYDCDFNQMLGLHAGGNGRPIHVRDLDTAAFENAAIATADHCYGCTAGQGSSCTGAL
ncbi:arsenosugar biosynthesis radical SAM (seleno)protein ArsS [Thioalkalivibrio sp. ALE19]|uniref:arsenosugar biosynthesis radical SAM (seleno)protein ArsS n=1 Tax=Thioalkalivibrio sp. ALE19 TaxID=1266909 RepID=UPI00048DCD81|nr:arsenosugar biosynthesis radical SAM (seleno)protein ArsS [Thioalkalivibrio sp. ALE19]